MKCSYYCDGYCFWNGDIGEVCDKIAYGTHKRIKDGYCLKEQNDRELEEHANAIIAEEERKRRERFLFRGKDKDDGKWYEGAYRAYDDTTYCFKEDYDRHPENTHHTIIFSRMTDWGLPNQHLQSEVIPETVGQYTGLQDKNGKKIFEGDIVQFEDEKPGQYEYHDDTFMNAGEVIYDGWRWVFTNRVAVEMDDLIDRNRADCEVIGNIHDNPDLLRGRKI